jgi:tetratricopeptide (TPR) repeat protein/DNA-binding XRE family transcriptional regulator
MGGEVVAEPPAAPFGELLRELRTAAQLTQEELAAAARVAPRTVSDLERGESKTARRVTASRLAAALELEGPARARFIAIALGRDPADEPVAADQAAATRTLPRDIASFTGRQPQLRRLVAASQTAAQPGGVVGICVITGMAGVGKTSLALRAAHQVTSQFPDGQIFLDLQGYTEGLDPLSTAEALDLLMQSLGIPLQRDAEKLEARAARYRHRLAGSRTLIILDNASSTAQLTPLLPGTAGCMVIVTSRRLLPGLDDAQAIAVDVLPEPDAIALFRAIAGSGRIPANDAALTELVGLCGRLPLAVRMIAARLAYRDALRIEDLVEQLRHERGRLANLQDDHRSLTAVLAVSYDHLGDAEQRMFRLLGLIPGPDFDACAAANLAETDLGEATMLLDSLLDQNLLIQRTARRYRFHDLVRAYARTLTEPGAALDRLLDYYLHTAQRADRHFERRMPRIDEPAGAPEPRTGPDLDTPEQAKEWIAAELANLDAATHYAADHDRPAQAIGLPAALAQYLRAYGSWAQALTLYQRALDAARAIADRSAQAGALTHLGSVQWSTGAFGQSEESLAGAQKLYRELGNRRGQASVLAELGVVQRLTAEYPQAKDTLAKALQLYRELADRHGQAFVLAELGVTQRQTGTFGLAEDMLTEALALYRGLGNRHGEANTLAYLASVQWSVSAFQRVGETLDQALVLYRQLGDRHGQANTLIYLGCLQGEAGSNTEAQETLSQAVRLFTEFGEHHGRAAALAYLGLVQLQAGRYPQAQESLTQALQLFRELRDAGGQAEVLNHYAALIAETGTPEQARSHYEEALQLARTIKSAKDEADALNGIALTHQSEGDLIQARIHFRQALALYQSCDCPTDAARVEAALEVLVGSPESSIPA